MSEWISGGRALQSMQQFGTKVWLYFNEAGFLVGFGSLGTTRRNWPPPNGDFQELGILPALAIQTDFQSGPKNDPPKFSDQIMNDLIYKARRLGPPILMLDVHKDNHPAIRLYERFDFQSTGYERDSYVRMSIRFW